MFSLWIENFFEGKQFLTLFIDYFSGLTEASLFDVRKIDIAFRMRDCTYVRMS